MTDSARRATWTRHILAYAFLTLAVLGALVPFITTTISSFKTDTELVQGALSLPKVWQWQNYVTAWVQGKFGIFFRNSVIVAVLVVVPSVILSAMTGFAFARYRFRGAGVLFAVFLLGMTIPSQALVIPLFYELKFMGLLNSHAAMILPQIAMSLSFGTLLMRTAFANLPREISEAAMVDGCTSWQAFWRVLLPLVRPILGTLALLFFIWTWNEFFLPFVVTTVEEYQTLPVGLLYFQQRWTSNVPVLCAGATIIFLPLTLLFLIFQRQLIEGIIAGSVKG